MPYGCSSPYRDIFENYKNFTMEEMCLVMCSLVPVVFDKAWTGNNSDEYYKMMTLLSCFPKRAAYFSMATPLWTTPGAAWPTC